MRWVFRLGLVVAAVSLSACADPKFKTYNGPEVTQVVVQKAERKMHLVHHDKLLKTYDIGLGFAPEGDKERYGDGKTPEGFYYIDRRNPNSRFHLSLGINYPNAQDIAEARANGVDPGGDIFIHGRPKRWQNGERDWTWGCVGVTNEQIEEIYAMVDNGTPVWIHP